MEEQMNELSEYIEAFRMGYRAFHNGFYLEELTNMDSSELMESQIDGWNTAERIERINPYA